MKKAFAEGMAFVLGAMFAVVLVELITSGIRIVREDMEPVTAMPYRSDRTDEFGTPLHAADVGDSPE